MRKIRFGPRSFVKLVYPDGLCCCLCGDELFDDKDFCSDCEPPVLSHVCRVCGRALPDESGREYCDGCLNGQRGLLFNAARAPYSYADERVKHLIWNLKYNDATYLAEVLAKPMVEVLRKQDWEVDVITYVPMHPRKQRMRAYNQAQLLAREVGRLTGLPVETLLSKLVYSKKSATKLGRADRVKLLEGSFGLTGQNVRGKSVLLVDDVMTSSTTVNECSKMLRLAKAAKVYVLTVATSLGEKLITYDPNDKSLDPYDEFDE